MGAFETWGFSILPRRLVIFQAIWMVPEVTGAPKGCSRTAGSPAHSLEHGAMPTQHLGFGPSAVRSGS